MSLGASSASAPPSRARLALSFSACSFCRRASASSMDSPCPRSIILPQTKIVCLLSFSSPGGHHHCDCSTLNMRIMLWIAACATASAFAPSPAPFGLTAGSRAQVITVVPRGQCHCAGGAAMHASADGLRRPRHTDGAVARSSSGATATLCSPVLAPVSLSVRAHLSRVEHSQLIIDCVLAVHRGIRTAHTRPTSR